MMSDRTTIDSPVVDVQGISKRYRLGVIGAGTFRAELDQWWQRKRHRRDRKHEESAPESTPSEIWALRDVVLQVRAGEVMGLIGPNGAGKSTLLKVLTRITEPTSGRAVLRGRVGSLLEVGTGFHPELTGRENLYLNGAILGMKKQEIEAKYDEIVEFSGVRNFIDTPVKRYSSGMRVRLGFAVAAHLEPEILLIDEVLAVGDVEFQKRCLGKMESIAEGGRTVLFVSHNMIAVSKLCHRCAVIDNGRLAYIGETDEAIRHYLQSVRQFADILLEDRTDRQGNGVLRFTGCVFRGGTGSLGAGNLCAGEDAAILIHYKSRNGLPLKHVKVAVGIRGTHGEPLCHLDSGITGDHFSEIPGEGVFECRIPRLPLQSGRFTFAVFANVSGQIADWVQEAGVMDVSDGDFFRSGRMPPPAAGPFLVDHEWGVSTK